MNNIFICVIGADPRLHNFHQPVHVLKSRLSARRDPVSQHLQLDDPPVVTEIRGAEINAIYLQNQLLKLEIRERRQLEILILDPDGDAEEFRDIFKIAGHLDAERRTRTDC